MSSQRPKLRADVHAHVVGPSLAVLDTRSGIELIEGRLATALPPLLKGETLAAIIGHAETSHALEVVCQLEELERRGLVETEAGVEPSTVSVTDYLDPQLEEVNRRALAEGHPWMLARPHGTILWIGPVFVPGRGPCWACMAARLRAVRAAWQLPERRSDDAPVAQIGLELAALEAARWRRQPDAPARLLTFDTQTLDQQAHVIVQQADCPACGDAAARRSFTPLVLRSTKKAFTFDGGHRAFSPEETYARYEHLVSPLTGIVHSVAREAADSGSLNVFAARHNFAIVGQSHPGRSHGKGMTAAQARCSALCEALERFSGVFRGDEPRLTASFRDLGEDAIHPNACLGFSDRQYREREAWNRDAPRLLWTPEPFDEAQETEWVPAWSLTHERKRSVAAALCYYGYQSAFARADSNGAAAGSCAEDAVLQGLLELVERDAAGIWWYARVRRPAFAFQSPFFSAMRSEHSARGRRLGLLDLTTDLGLPVCAAVSIGATPESLQIGFGAHLDPAVAATRAITEANQLLAVKRSSRLFRADLAHWSFLEPDGAREPSTSIPPSDDLQRDVLACVQALRERGLEVLVVNQTRADVELPVMKVLVPGLRHFRPRFGPGRLYDVPLQLGWVARPLREDELNPAHITA